MNENTKNVGSLLFLYAESPLHVGSGEGLGAVDLPLQRERMSRLPMVAGSGIKGALREVVDDWEGPGDGKKDWTGLTEDLFGPPPPDPDREDASDPGAHSGATDETFAGAMTIQDGRLLLLALRSVHGGWAWATCPFILDRLRRDLELLGGPTPCWTVPSIPAENVALVADGSAVAPERFFLVEDVAYEAVVEPQAKLLAEWLKNAVPSTGAYAPFAARLPRQIAILSDTEFTWLAEHCTEVNVRVRMDPATRTVKSGALWSEECLPAESMLWTVALFSRSRKRMEEGNAPRVASTLQTGLHEALAGSARIRLGGDQTIGRGIVGVRTWLGGRWD